MKYKFLITKEKLKALRKRAGIKQTDFKKPKGKYRNEGISYRS